MIFVFLMFFSVRANVRVAQDTRFVWMADDCWSVLYVESISSFN